ncbi:peroxidase 12-like protein [Tanacetum coccineum]
MLRATQPTTIQSAILKAGILIDEVVRCGTLTKGNDKRKEMEESSNQGSTWKDNKKAKTRSGFVATVPPRNDNESTYPKCARCYTFHPKNASCRLCYNCQKPGHLAKQCWAPIRQVAPVNAVRMGPNQRTLANLPAPTSNASTILSALATKNLTPTDVVALSGGTLSEVCPTNTTDATTVMDILSPIKFDNKYFVDLMNRHGLFTSDQDLYTHKETKPIVESFAHDEKLFFEKFVKAMIKMGQMEVLTGGKGEIRAHCSIRNPDNKAYFSYLVEEEELSYLESKAELR